MDDALPTVSTTARNALRSGWSPWAATPGSRIACTRSSGCRLSCWPNPDNDVVDIPAAVSGSRVTTELDAERVEPSDRRSRTRAHVRSSRSRYRQGDRLPPTHRKTLHGPVRIITALAAVLALASMPAPAAVRGAVQEEPQEQIAALGRALGMTAEEVEALGLSPEEVENLLAGLTEETVVVGSRAQPRRVTASPVPVDVLSTTELTSQGSVNLQDQLQTIVPSFAVNTQPISDASTVVRPAMLRNLAPDHTLVLVNGKRRHRSSIPGGSATVADKP